jgi:hypothetical protein
MFKTFYLEWKAFLGRPPSQLIWLENLMGFIAIYFILVFLALELLLYSRKMNLDPIVTYCK